MVRILMIDADTHAGQALGLACLERGVGIVLAETVCEGVRALLATPVTLVVVDGSLLRSTPREAATLLERVAPGVPVAVSVRPETPLDVRVAFELAGFRVLTRPVSADELLDKARAAESRA